MIQFYGTYNDNEIVSTLLSQISWSNNLTILSSTKTMEEKEFYISMFKNNYSERELSGQIACIYYQRYIPSNGSVLESVEKTIARDICIKRYNFMKYIETK